MKIIRSLMGRRQFLMGAVATSTLGLVSKKTANAFTPGAAVSSGVDVAMAAESDGLVDLSDVSDRYKHLMSPLKIGNVVLKNRLLCPQSTPHFLQGPENFPSEIMRDYYVAQAKNGAGIISVRIMSDRVRSEQEGDSRHMIIYDLDDYGVQNYLEQMVEGVHIYGSKVCADLQVRNVMPGAPSSEAEDPAEILEKMIEAAVTRAKYYESRGFDALQVGIRGNESVTIALIDGVKRAVPNMLVITEVMVKEPSITQHITDGYYRVGTTLDGAIKYAKKLEGKADILMVRIADAGAAHATTWNTIKGKPYSIRYAEAIKKSGAKIIVAPGGGFLDLDLNESYIAEGKADMITMARAFICDPKYGKKMAAGRGEEVVPCIKCNKCHGEHRTEGPWYTVCSVNPKIGIPAAVKIIRPPGAPKKVAVIGGGPAGMKAAITAAERGHSVTLYEKSPVLGGLARHSDYSPYKWAIKDFKDYLVRHVDMAGVEVLLNTAASPEMIKERGYDTILVALGSDPVIPGIPGADGSNVFNIIDAYPKEKSMGKNVVVIGGGEFGADAGMHLAKAGHNVTMLTSGRELFPINQVHYPETMVQAYEDLKSFSIITEAMATGISKGKVTYSEAGGSDKSIQTDSVVIYAGFRPKKDEALKFYGSAKQFFTIGDCSEQGGNIQKCIRSAFFTASQV